MNSFFSPSELSKLGFRSLGKDVLLSRKASVYNADAISLCDNIRIDDFCILSGGSGISIGNHVHISAYCAIYGGGGVSIGDYSGLSARCVLLSESDSFNGDSLLHPFIPVEFKPGFVSAPVILRRFVQIGTNSTVMPDIELEEGVVVGAHSFVNKNCSKWGIYFGVPAQRVRDRSRNIIHLAADYEKSIGKRNLPQ